MENTSNYGLKRWDPKDRILHTEFNDNWDKIDAALGTAARQAAFHTILDVTTTEDLKDAAWPLNIDWTVERPGVSLPASISSSVMRCSSCGP